MIDLGTMLLDHYIEYLGDYMDADSYSDDMHQIQRASIIAAKSFWQRTAIMTHVQNSL